MTTFAPDAASSPAPAGAATPETVATPEMVPTPGPVASAGTLAPAPGRRPTKFLADLTRAMQAAAEQARSVTLDQFRAEGTTVIEQIHARSATGATELRRHADDDAAAIKDWSKAEIARIREETEQRVASRREQLDGQLERHAALIEHEIEKVRGRVSTFETNMGTFFDELLQEEDPATFAALAASLPEPPSFEDLDDDALAALLREPGVGVPILAPEAPEAVEAVEVQAAEAADGSVAAVETPDVPADEVAPLDRETAMAAIQAAAEAAASLEAAEGHADRAEAAADRAEAVATPDAPASDESATAAEADAAAASDTAAETAEAAPEAEVVAADDAIAAEPVDTLAAAEPVAEPVAEAGADDGVEPEPARDPRLAMLGLTPDFAAAELEAAEAAAAAAADTEEMPEIGGDVLAARLSGLVPSESTPAPAVPTASTQVVVTGLVSVASIASFKRHLGRLAGVAHVGVSSGPDGEFVFAVDHDPATSLRDLIPTLPGFGARVVGTGDGIVQVSAQDPQD